MSSPWLVLHVLAAALVVAVERPRFESRFGANARKARERDRRKKQLRVITTDYDSDEFVRSVQADLDSLPTIEERPSFSYSFFSTSFIGSFPLFSNRFFGRCSSPSFLIPLT